MKSGKSFNHCTLATDDPIYEERHKIACEIRQKLQLGIIDQVEAKRMLRMRKDEKEIREILERLADENTI